MGPGSIAVAVDVGGTFTDVVCVDERHGRAHVVKVPTTPGRIADGVVEGTRLALAAAGVAPGDVARFVHGTTTGTNAVLERRGATVGLLATEGFEDVLEIGRTRRSVLYDLAIGPQTPVFLAPGRRRRGVRERVGADGAVVLALDEQQARAQIRSLVAAGAEALAVCLLHGYRNPAHERRLRELAHEEAPGLPVSLASEVDPVFREYERTVVTAFDAYLRPVVEAYVRDLAGRLEGLGVRGRLQVMQSRGGIASADLVVERPVSVLLSGPAAGVVGGVEAAARSGIDDVITVDVGGTSADVALVVGGRPLVTTEGGIDGWPLRVPLVDVSTIGAGGGSIAWVDGAGSFRVGPRSAGSEPGPACYGRGGVEPTVTDASLVLGYLDPGGLAGGALPLDLDAARAAVGRLAGRLGLGVEAAAAGIHHVVGMRMVDQIRLVSVGRGHDPRSFALVALGGAGPVHATRLAAELGIGRVVVPPAPGALAALGLLGAAVEHERATTVAARADACDPAALEAALAALADEVDARMRADDVPPGGATTRRAADARYAGQASSLEVPLDDAPLDGAAVARAVERFHETHRRVHGHASPGKPVELVNLRVVQSWRPPGAPPVPVLDAAGAHARSRRVWLTDASAWADVPVVPRALLDGPLDGPAIVEQPDTTLVLHPGDRVAPDGSGNLLVEVGGAQ
ncbi:MAG: hydantoinase/oxoprolinase family protein [Thermoleophilia bacterium]